MNNSSVNAASNSSPQPASNSKSILIGIAVVVVMIFAAFGVGLWQGRLQLVVQNSRHEQEISKLNNKISLTEVELNAAENRGYLFQARAALYRSAIDLDNRNFGTANAHLKEAAESLSKIKSKNATMKVAGIGNLRDAIAKTNINVAVDLEQQRAQVLSFAKQLTELNP